MDFALHQFQSYYNFAVAPFPGPIIRTAFMTIPSLVTMYASLAYYSDFLQSQSLEFYDSRNIEEYDFIIVGGGSAGAVVANRLSKQYSVLLVEAGGDPSPLASIPSLAFYLQRIKSTDYQFETESQNNSCLALRNQKSYWPRGRGLGGCSNLNFMIYQRGHPGDFEEWVNATGDPKWSYENVLEYFKKSEHYEGNFKDHHLSSKFHGTGGDLYVGKLGATYMAEFYIKAARELGMKSKDPNSYQTNGFSQIDVTIKDGRRWDTYTGFLRPILKRPTLQIMRYSRATKIHLDKTRTAYGVSYVRHGVVKFARAKKEVIITAGAIDSPKLLMLSGIGVKNELNALGIKCRAHLPVGKNLQDHVTTLVGPFIHNSSGLIIDRDTNIHTLNEYTHYGRGPLSSIGGISAVGYFSSSLSRERGGIPDIQYLPSGSGVHSTLAKDFSRILGFRPGILEKYLQPWIKRDANFVLVTLGKPRSLGEIRLASTDPFDKPLIQPNYYKNPDDMQIMVEGVDFLVNLFERTQTFQRIGAQLAPNPFPGCEHIPFKTYAYYECYLRHYTLTLYHPSGTNAMGKSPNNAVVDSNLRVFKTRNLRVADASVLPTITNANLNAIAILMGEMSSNLILEYWSKQSEISKNYHSLYDDQKCFYNSAESDYNSGLDSETDY